MKPPEVRLTSEAEMEVLLDIVQKARALVDPKRGADELDALEQRLNNLCALTTGRLVRIGPDSGILAEIIRADPPTRPTDYDTWEVEILSTGQRFHLPIENLTLVSPLEALASCAD